MVDPRIERTQRDLSNALLLLLRNKNINDISVIDLCNKANINRSTFYAHYHNIREILDDLETEFLNEFNIFKSLFWESDRIQLVTVARYENELMQTLLNNTDLEKTLYKNTLNQIKYKYRQSSIEDYIFEISVSYLVSGTLSVLKNCISKIVKVSDEEIANLLSTINLKALALLDTEPALQKIAI